MTARNLVANPRAVSTATWGIRSTGTLAVATGGGKGGLNGLQMTRKVDALGLESVYFHTDPGVQSNGLNAPNVSAYVGQYAVGVFEARALDVARTANITHVFANSAGTLIEAPGGGGVVMPVSANPEETVRCWFARKIPAGAVTNDIRLQAVSAGEGERFVFSRFMLYIAETEPKALGEILTYFDGTTPGHHWQGTADASISAENLVGGLSLAGSGSASLAGVRKRSGACALTGAGALAGVAKRRRFGVARFDGNSFISDVGVRRRFSGERLSATGAFNAALARRYTKPGAGVLSDEPVGSATISDQGSVG